VRTPEPLAIAPRVTVTIEPPSAALVSAAVAAHTIVRLATVADVTVAPAVVVMIAC
jgi:hypothetical protein